MRKFLIIVVIVSSCLSPTNNDDELECEEEVIEKIVSKLGIHSDAQELDSVYTRIELKDINLPILGQDHIDVLKGHQKLLKIKGHSEQKYGNLTITDTALLSVVNSLQAYQYTEPYELINNLDLYQIWGGDKRGHVQFTGYFTPIIRVNDTFDETYFYPIYDFPSEWKGSLPSRAEIDGKFVLDGMNLELAYAKSAVDVYFMQIQGSGYVEYPDGTLRLLEYNGSNRHPYRSIGKYVVSKEDLDLKDISMDGIKRYLKMHPEQIDSLLFQNPSYTFFRFSKRKPKGAGQVSLTEMISVAVDKKYIPLGSCLLAKIPKVKKGKVIDYEYKILYAQDVGGAIKGSGHIDVYMGVGIEAKKKASRLYHYGELFLILPKSN